MKEFLTIILWEFAQNLPPVVAFVVAAWLWQQKHKTAALICIVVGSAAGALVIRLTEMTRLYASVQPVAATITNFVFFCLAMLSIVVYLNAKGRFNNWKTDIILGIVLGSLLSISQWITSGGHIIANSIHALAMALPVPLILMTVRQLLKKAHSLISAAIYAVLLATVMTLVIGVVDYAYLLFLP
jgi:hypothetical protein